MTGANMNDRAADAQRKHPQKTWRTIAQGHFKKVKKS